MLYLTDPIDEFAITSLRVYQGKELTSIDSADLDLPETAETTEAEPKPRNPGQGERIRPRPRPVPRRAGQSGPRGPRVETADR